MNFDLDGKSPSARKKQAKKFGLKLKFVFKFNLPCRHASRNIFQERWLLVLFKGFPEQFQFKAFLF